MVTTTSTSAYRYRALAYGALCLGCIALSSCTTTGQWPGAQPASLQPRAPAQAAGVQPGYYRVAAGDTLASVAAGFGQRTQDIAEWNRLPVNASIVPGQVLRVVPPVAANANGGGGPAIRLAWPAYGQALRSSGTANAKKIVIVGGVDEPVKAAADGQVIYVGNAVDQYASLIIVKHGDTLVTAYALNGPVTVKEGDAVKKGQQIATMGADRNGRSTLEFELRRAGTPIDPLAYLPR
jgi:lipoprotein NlpD